MTAPSVVIVSQAPSIAALSPHDAHWRDRLLDELARIKAQMRIELDDAHPGARHRIAALIDRGADCRQQLARLGVPS